jgi:DUF1680 family protein
MPVRLTEPHPRIDAVRGCVAIERGPLVYCMEEVDLPDGVELADIAIRMDGGLAARPADDLLDGIVEVALDAVVRSPTGWSGGAYRTVGDDGPSPAQPIELTAVPYYAWGNRGTGTMRVWIPTA